MADNGWEQHRKVVEYRLDKTDTKIDELTTATREITTSVARIEERTTLRSSIWGGIAGFLSGLSSWLK